MYRPAIGMMICLTTLGTGHASIPKPSSRLAPSTLTAQTIVPDGSNLEQTTDWAVRLWQSGNEQGAENYVESIARIAKDPATCQARLDNFINMSIAGGIVKSGDTILAMFRPNSRSIDVLDTTFEDFNPCRHENEKPDLTGLQSDPIKMDIDVFNISRSDKSPGRNATNRYINSVADKAHFPDECRGQLQMFAELGQNPTAEVKTLDGKPVGITARQGINLLVIDLQAFKTKASCIASKPQ